MSSFNRFTKLYRVTSASGGVPSLGNKNIALRIPRQRGRLEKLEVITKINQATSSLAGDTSTNLTALDIFDEVRLRVSDAHASNRLLVQCPGSSLAMWQRYTVGQLNRHAQYLATKPDLAAGTYYVTHTIPVMDPLMSELVGIKTALPMQDNLGTGEDPTLELDLAAAVANFGYVAGGTTTLAGIRVRAYFRDVPDDVPYIPTELKTNLVTWSQWPDGWELPGTGFLARLLNEGWSVNPLTVTNAARIDVLALSSGSAPAGTAEDTPYWQILVGKTSVDEFDQPTADCDDDEWVHTADIARAIAPSPGASTENTGYNERGVWLKDLLHVGALGEAMSPATMLQGNLWTSNRGDVMKVRPSGTISSSVSRITTHKVLVKDLTPLLGA